MRGWSSTPVPCSRVTVVMKTAKTDLRATAAQLQKPPVKRAVLGPGAAFACQVRTILKREKRRDRPVQRDHRHYARKPSACLSCCRLRRAADRAERPSRGVIAAECADRRGRGNRRKDRQVRRPEKEKKPRKDLPNAPTGEEGACARSRREEEGETKDVRGGGA